MRLDLSAVFKNPGCDLPFDMNLDFNNIEIDKAYPFKNCVHVFGNIENVATSVLLTLNVNTVADTFCDRCLESVSVKIEKCMQYYLSLDKCDEDNDGVIVVEDSMLDIYPIAYDAVVLEFFQKHLCREDCAGLCDVCGVNLNLEKCSCEKKQADSRLSVLAQLLEEK